MTYQDRKYMLFDLDDAIDTFWEHETNEKTKAIKAGAQDDRIAAISEKYENINDSLFFARNELAKAWHLVSDYDITNEHNKPDNAIDENLKTRILSNIASAITEADAFNLGIGDNLFSICTSLRNEWGMKE